MKTPPPLLEGLRRSIASGPMRGFEAILAIASAYLAARQLGAGAAAIVSGLWALIISLAWARRAARLDEAIRHFSRQSWTDDLTGLGNDRSFRARLDGLVRGHRSSPLSLILIDVDHFKSYNDTYGHPEGDEVLKAIGSILRASAPEATPAHRLGGDEFALLAGTDLAGARELAGRLRSAIQEHPWRLRPVTASFGLASSANDGGSASELRSRADRELYRSKERGRNRVSDPSGDMPSDG